MDVRIKSLQHIGIPVSNISVSLAFYQKLGFESVMESSFQYEGNGGYVHMMKLHDIILEIYQMPEQQLAEIRNRKNGHIDHIAFDVDDIEQTYATLKANGMNPIEAAPVFLAFWKKGCRYLNINGPDGERLEFNQIL